MLEPLFNNIAGLQACNFIKKIQKKPSEVFYRNSCSLKFRSIHRKTPTQEALFVKVVSLQASNVMKKRLRHRCFSMNIVKFLRIPALKNTYEQLLLTILQHCCFPMIFAKFLRTSILKNMCKRLLLFVSPQNTITMSGG